MNTDALREIRDMVSGDMWDRGRAYDLIGDRATVMLMLDAAKALHEALLPGWGWSVSDTGDVTLWPPGLTDEQNAGAVEVSGDMAPARAWLLAILDALIAKETDDAK